MSVSIDSYLLDNPNSFLKLFLTLQWMRQWFGGTKLCVVT